ncbi:MAG TPA: zf-TFIIB domain-containing protein [Phycisphaerales bacterium]|nr:zf-TFIIB domain-containing protein [Phycisphaerales bacterium]
MKVPRKLANPVVSVLLFAALWWTLAQLPKRDSILGEAISISRRSRPIVPSCSITRDGNNQPALWTVGMSDPQPVGDQAVGDVVWEPWFCHPTGFAFHTGRVVHGNLHWSIRTGNVLTDDEKKRLRPQFVDCMTTYWFPRIDPETQEAIDALRQGDVTITRPIYSGYWKNAGLTTMFFTFLFSLAWVPDAWRRYQVGTRVFRLERNQCPGCAYDIRGLPDRQCPECGTTWDHDELDAALQKRYPNA